ncbi:thioesterase family protein [Nesterenkonia sp.]|uniref:acyl-CoA thioesterase n=1 Tax=Nesterenkonia sp. TaxID=704201 RepID=UPI0034571D31
MSYTPPEVAFCTPIPIRWSDQDLNGHVNNARALTLVEEARISASAHWAGGTSAHRHLPRVVRTMTMDFQRPIHYPDALEAYVWVTRIGSTSYTVHHDLVQNEQLCLSCDAVIVLLDPDTQQPTQIPEGLRTILAAALSHDARGRR